MAGRRFRRPDGKPAVFQMIKGGKTIFRDMPGVIGGFTAGISLIDFQFPSGSGTAAGSLAENQKGCRIRTCHNDSRLNWNHFIRRHDQFSARDSARLQTGGGKRKGLNLIFHGNFTSS